jgi:hypothetical protein
LIEPPRNSACCFSRLGVPPTSARALASDANANPNGYEFRCLASIERSDIRTPPGPEQRWDRDKHHICAAQRAFLSLGYACGRGVMMQLADYPGSERMQHRAPGGQSRVLRGANGARDAPVAHLVARQPRPWRSIARIHGLERPT